MRTRPAVIAVGLVGVFAGLSACTSSAPRAVNVTTAVRPATVTSAVVTSSVVTSPVVTGAGGRRPFGGYGEAELIVSRANGTDLAWCILLALTEAQHERGLMDVTDLGGYDGMLFRFGSPQRLAFYMFQTKLPLSIAFLDGSGGVVSTTDMAPCTETNGNACPLYRADGPYADALEVVQGDLGRLGIMSGAKVRVGGSCSS